MFKNSCIILSILVFMGCSQRVHKNFSSNKYISNYNIHIVNDSLQLYLKSPADIHYITDRKKLSKIVKQKESTYKNVLLYGKAGMAPFYEYFLILDHSTPLHKVAQKNIIELDTILVNHKISLIGKNLDSDTIAYKTDIKNIFKSIRLGLGYRKDISTVMDIVSDYHRSNRFIQAYEEIKNFPAYDEDEAWLKLQMQLTFASFLENQKDYDELIKNFEPGRRQDSISEIIKQNLIAEPQVYEEITAKAKLTNLVMVNENHFMP